MVLTIKTDQPTAELSLFNGEQLVDELTWHAHRELASTILTKLTKLLKQNDAAFEDLTGIIVFEGPGSFTGLRIGATVANTLAYSLTIPVVSTGGDNWQTDGVARVKSGGNDEIVQPVYGGEANITRPRK